MSWCVYICKNDDSQNTEDVLYIVVIAPGNGILLLMQRWKKLGTSLWTGG